MRSFSRQTLRKPVECPTAQSREPIGLAIQQLSSPGGLHDRQAEAPSDAHVLRRVEISSTGLLHRRFPPFIVLMGVEEPEKTSAIDEAKIQRTARADYRTHLKPARQFLKRLP